ncbi:MAG: iron-containing alcohol dehydrogenase [bacterium]
MNNFNYFQPTKLYFGVGRIAEVGKIVAEYGTRCLLVTVSGTKEQKASYSKVIQYLKQAKIKVAHFDGVVPNPTTESITAGAKIAKQHKADVVLGFGGGSSMDTAKAIAVEATHPGTCWDYLFYKKAPTEKTLPIIAITTTSGTGSQVTQVAVVTNTQKRDKSALYHSNVYPSAAIIDPQLMVTVPKFVTATTGFDVFAHAFEAYIHPNASPYIKIMAVEAITLVLNNLPKVLKNGNNLEARSAMAWADTLGGLCIANAGVTLPHGIGMAIGGMYPHVAHGEALALVYPAFTRYTYKSAVNQFATLARIFKPSLSKVGDKIAAEKACSLVDKFLKDIGLWYGLKEKNVPKEELAALAKQSMVLPDYKSNPKVATASEMNRIIESCYCR